MTEQLTIDHVGHRGDGVAIADGHPIYVPYALPGERVTAAPVPGHPDRRRLVGVERASPDRVAPFCGHFGSCGGCAIQHWRPAAYLGWKRQLVVDALSQAGVAAAVDDIVDAHGTGRRRIVAHARRAAGATLQVGFVRMTGTTLGSLEYVPQSVLRMLGRQFGNAGITYRPAVRPTGMDVPSALLCRRRTSYGWPGLSSET